MDSIKKKMEKLSNETADAESRIAHFEEIKAQNEAEADKFEEQVGLRKIMKMFAMIFSHKRLAMIFSTKGSQHPEEDASNGKRIWRLHWGSFQPGIITIKLGIAINKVLLKKKKLWQNYHNSWRNFDPKKSWIDFDWI